MTPDFEPSTQELKVNLLAHWLPSSHWAFQCLFLVSPPSCQAVKLGNITLLLFHAQSVLFAFLMISTLISWNPAVINSLTLEEAAFGGQTVLSVRHLVWISVCWFFFLFINNTMTAVHVQVRASQPASPTSHHGSATSHPGIFEAKASQLANLLVWVTSSVKKALAKRLYNSYN